MPGYNQACNLQEPQIIPDENGVDWYTYTVFLNFDNQNSAEPAFIPLQQTRVECRIPAKIQESANEVNLADGGDIIDGQVADEKLWETLQLDVYNGGTGPIPQYPQNPLASGETIMLGENVKLAISDESPLSNYKYISNL